MSRRAPTPDILVKLGALAIITIFLSLGFWQLERADERRDQAQQAQERNQLSPVYLTHFPDEEITPLEGRRVRLRGQYADQHFLLDNQVVKKQLGYYVLTPFELSNYSQVILIDRGWVPAKQKRSQLPSLPALDTSEMQIEGTLYQPQLNPFVDADYLLEGRGWPQVIQAIEFSVLAERLGELELVPATLRLGETQPHGFLRIWPKSPMTAEKHTGYAVQWFAMAAIAVFLLVWYLFRVSRNS